LNGLNNVEPSLFEVAFLRIFLVREIIEWVVRFVVSTFYRAGASLGHRITLKLSSSYISQENKEKRHSFFRQRKNWTGLRTQRRICEPSSDMPWFVFRIVRRWRVR